MIYILNTLITPIDFSKYQNAEVKFEKITLEKAKQLLQNPQNFTSAVGHEATAVVLTQLLGVEIQAQRKSVFFEPGDEGIHFFLKERLPEGKILNQDELKTLSFDLIYSKRIK